MVQTFWPLLNAGLVSVRENSCFEVKLVSVLENLRRNHVEEENNNFEQNTRLNRGRLRLFQFEIVLLALSC